jgi:hypothetical protein
MEVIDLVVFVAALAIVTGAGITEIVTMLRKKREEKD